MFDQQPSAIFGGADTPLSQQIYVYRNGQPVPYVPPSLDEAKQAAWGMTGIPDMQQAYQAFQRGEYLPALGQGLFGALGLASMAAPAARGAMSALKAAGPVLADTSGVLNLGKAADRMNALRLENEGITPNAMESGGFFQRLAQQLQPQGIRAYHGSPHDFDRFDISKIGTGEGAQAYGHGLYFAESEPTAAYYRQTLSPSGMRLTMEGGQSVVAAPSSPEFLGPVVDAMRGIEGPDFLKQTIARRYVNGAPLDARAVLEEGIGIDRARAYPQELEQGLPIVQRMIEQAQPSLGKFKVEKPGKMYEVNINASPDAFLNWDKPFMDQPQGIQDALSSYVRQLEQTGQPMMSGYVRDMNRGLLPGSSVYQGLGRGTPESATAAWQQQGVPGIRYLDQGSRGAGEGSSNYVLFDDSLIEILRKYGLAGLAAPGALSIPFSADAQTR